MSIYKRNSIYWMEFLHSGRRFRRTTGVSNRRQAEQIEAAFKTQLARGEVGIEDNKLWSKATSFGVAKRCRLRQ